MFKILVRILVILLVAGIVSGGLYVLANTSSGQALILSLPGGHGADQHDIAQGQPAQSAFTVNTAGPGSLPSGFQGAPHDGGDLRGGASLQQALPTVAGEIGQIALVMAVIVVLQKGVKRLTRKRTAVTV